MEAKPEFYSVFMPHINFKRMRVCDAFLTTLSNADRILDEVTLRNSLNKAFCVDVSVENSKVYFDKGWTEFVVENGLEMGFILVFRFDGHCGFDVKIFDHSRCEKYRCKDAGIEVEDDSNNVVDDNGVDVDVEEDEDEDKDEEDTHGPKKPSGYPRELRDDEFVPLSQKNPYFIVDMKEQNVSPSYPARFLYVPMNFANKHLKKFTAPCTLLDPGKMPWSIKVRYTKSTKTWWLGHGWTSFAKGNKLQVGDTCVFELIEPEPLQLKVSILRAVTR